MTPQQRYNAAMAEASDLTGHELRIARVAAYNAYTQQLMQDMADVSAWAADRHGIDDVWLRVEVHISSREMCDLAICNAPFIEPRSLRVAVRDDATCAFEFLGYRFEFRSGFDVEDRSTSADYFDLSSHQRLRAIKRIGQVGLYSRQDVDND